jgi:hypothetical protein
MKFNHSNKSIKSIWKTAAGAAAVNVLLTLAAFAQAAAPGRISAPANGSTTDFVTTNGLKTIHRHVTGNDVVAAQIYFRGGARNVTEKNAGVESLLFEVATEGTKNFSKSEINREMARMGTVIDGDSGYDFSVVELRCVRQNFDRSWQLLTDMILNPACDDKEVALVSWSRTRSSARCASRTTAPKTRWRCSATGCSSTRTLTSIRQSARSNRSAL